MLCSKCGTTNSDEAAFCKNCGASLFNQESPQETVETYEEEVSENSVINIIKKVASSGIFLAGAICLSIYVFLQFISAFSGNFAFEYMKIMMGLSGYENLAVDGVFDIIGTVFTSTVLIELVPIILVVIGLWNIYSSARKTEFSMKTTGLNLIRGVVIFELVALSVLLGGIVVLLLLCMAAINELPLILSEALNTPNFSGTEISAEFLMVLFVTLFVMLLLVFVLNLLIYIKTLKTIKTIKNSLAAGALAGRISMFLIVILFIIGGTNALSFSLTGMSVGAAYILFGICLNKLREDFSKLNSIPEFPEF